QSVRVSLAAPFSAAVPLFSFPRLCPPRSTLFPYTTLFRSVPFGGGKERTSTVVTTELCQYSDCFDTKTPRIIVSQLDLVQATEGHNFTGVNNITFYSPPQDNRNIIVTKGSYRIVETASGQRLGLRGYDSDGNYVDGYIDL